MGNLFPFLPMAGSPWSLFLIHIGLPLPAMGKAAKLQQLQMKAERVTME
jgi:hypothetical protein